MTLEATLFSLGTAAVRAATKLWLGDHDLAAEVGSNAVDLLASRLTTLRDRRRLARLVENFADAVVDRVDPILENEFRELPENERLAAVEAVRDTFEKASFVGADLFAADLDAGHLDKSIRRRSPNFTRLLSADAIALHDLLLRECCGYVIEISRGLPQFTPSALAELLRRETQILDEIREVLARLPQRDQGAGFEYDYRQLVARKLDHVEIFGVTLAESTRRYPLSVAYISLTATSGDEESTGTASRVETLLSGNIRLFIRGEAGLGKTTLLQWIAVRSARSDFPAKLADWNNTIPFLIPLRRYADRPLPAPERFVAEIGSHIADEMPKSWVHDQLRNGRAIILVDGVDELPEHRRNEAKTWLSDLSNDFPGSRFVVTSRPGATRSEWLRRDDFVVLDLEPMNGHDVRTFVNRWHDAVRSLCTDDTKRAELDAYEQGLNQVLNSTGHLRKLAGYPLLCALLCALYKDRRAALPSNRMELYDVALQMILERRDTERKITSLKGLNRTEKVLLLGDLAYWLIRNGRSDVEVDRAAERLASQLERMPQIEADSPTLYRHLLERSGLLREPIAGRVDFIHRTFQEYLAARSAIANADDVGQIVANAHLDQWHEVVIMAVGHATFAQREELISGLLKRAKEDTGRHDALVLLALASLETAPELSIYLRAEIQRRAEALLPPKSTAAAKSFASAGLFVLDLLANAQPRTARETILTIRALAETGAKEAIPLIARYRDDTRLTVQDELFRRASRFDQEEYRRSIIQHIPREIEFVDLDTNGQSESLVHYSTTTNFRILMQHRTQFDAGLIPKQAMEIYLHARNGPGVLDFSGCPYLPALNRMTLSTVEIIGDIAQSLPNLNSLTVLNHISPEWLTHPPVSLLTERISIHGVQDLEDLTPIAFTQASTLILGHCSDIANLDGIAHLSQHLRKLEIYTCGRLDIEQITKAENLRHLKIVNTSIVDDSPLYKLKQLQTLVLPGYDDDHIRAAQEQLPNATVSTQAP